MKCPYCNVEMPVTAVSKDGEKIVAKWFTCGKCNTTLKESEAKRIAKDLRSLPPSDR